MLVDALLWADPPSKTTHHSAKKDSHSPEVNSDSDSPVLVTNNKTFSKVIELRIQDFLLICLFILWERWILFLSYKLYV